MSTKKTNKAGAKKLGMVGCGTIEQMFKSRVRQRFGKVEGVVGIQVTKEKIVLRVVSQEVADKLPKTYERRPIETVVTGAIKKQTPAK
ncbi:MAG: hypothetical protein IT343_07270 [Candidatus Melainabacteria bacterium]|jgi:hypothetical protein|nr:hypothetical protein [Candidatus Melainabacteria bacterium]